MFRHTNVTFETYNRDTWTQRSVRVRGPPDRTTTSMRRSLPLRVLLAAVLTAAGPTLSIEASNPALLKLLKVLKDRGTLSAQEYDDLVAAAQAESAPVPAAGSAPTIATTATQASASAAEPRAQDKAASPSARSPETASVPPSPAKSGSGSDKPTEKPKAPKWYDQLNLRGYTQFRYHSILEREGAELNVPNDRSVAENNTFFIRRGRIILSGDVSEHLGLYVQPDLNASPGSGDFSVQLRDLYGDVYLDKAKEYRVRLGQSKVPFGWSNMQSSGNRAPLERTDAINSAAEGERDLGAFFYWAPDEIRKRYADLIKLGLKGSGDYGVVGFGAYSGQGLNRLDLNNTPHAIAKLSYPFQLASGQFFEAGVHAYSGRFVTGTQAITEGGRTFTPSTRAGGITDERVGIAAVWYPQPFGIEAEWNVGRGPELSADRRSITADTLHGGYIQFAYRDQNKLGNWFPFARWQYYSGGRKFAVNAPDSNVNELDFGIEWSPWNPVEFTVQFTHTFDRTNTRTAPYADTTSADRISLQAQINY